MGFDIEGLLWGDGDFGLGDQDSIAFGKEFHFCWGCAAVVKGDFQLLRGASNDIAQVEIWSLPIKDCGRWGKLNSDGLFPCAIAEKKGSEFTSKKTRFDFQFEFRGSVGWKLDFVEGFQGRWGLN